MIRNLTFYFGLILAAVIANNYALYSNMEKLQRNQDQLEQTYQVIQGLDRINAEFRSAESMARGFVLNTGDRTFRSEWEQHVDALWKQIDHVNLLTQTNPVQQRYLIELRELLLPRLKAMQDLMRTARQGAKGEALVDRVNEGKSLTGELRRLLGAMEAEQNRLMEERTEQTAMAERLVLWTFLFSAFVNLLLLSVAFWLIRRHLAAQADTFRLNEHKTWLQDKMLNLGKLLSSRVSPKEVSDEVLRFLTKELQFPAANFFIAQDGYLSRVATLAGPLTPRENTRFNSDEGLVGAALRRRDIHQVHELPPGYFTVESGLGVAQPKNLYFIPLYFQGSPLGVIELASFGPLDERQRDLLPQLQERVSTIMNAAMAQEKQADLLEETQRQAEELQAQQEELRTNNEELEEQAAALLRAQERQQTQSEELRQINEELEAQARSLEHQQEALNHRNDELESARRESEMRAVELERTNQYKSEFLAKMSHELRTPLNSMLILSALLGEDKDRNLTKQQLEFARTIHDAGADLLNLINDILDLSKLEAGKLTLNPETFSLPAFLKNVESQFRPMMERKNLKFSIETGAGAPETLRTDRQRLEQILRNLLSNAVKFTEEGEIRVDVQVVPGAAQRVRFAVTDTGIGIPPEKKQAIFEAFEQVDGTISRRFGGTGLGLTISRELAALLQGQLEVESQENAGSTFILEIPAAVEAKAKAKPEVKKEIPAPKRAAPPAEEPVHAVRPKNIDHLLQQIKTSAKGRSLLIVEDDPGFTKALEESSRSHGFQPLAVGDGETALELLKQHTPAAIILDVKLPGVSGMSVLENIKQNSSLRHVPIHMISALDYHTPAMRLGAIGYLDKPVSIDGIKGAFEKIEKMLDKDVKRVLVIEDDERQATAMKELLGGPGVEITAARSAKEALAQIDEQDFECVIVDLTLPDLSGLELLEKVHNALGEKVPPIIVYTGRDLSREEEEKLREFSESIIIKGAKSPERLLDEVNLFLHRVESELPEEQQTMLTELRLRERGFEGRSVLLVDDDLRNIFALTSALESKGLKVVAARNGFEALEALEKNPNVDAVLMDIMMPKMDGYEAIKRIRQIGRFKELPIIALTAKAMKGDHERCLQAGANDYLPKPVNLMNLISVLKVWVAGKGMWM
jgi:CheY-like chemotaxis protein/CHASE3 domain sensor protein